MKTPFEKQTAIPTDDFDTWAQANMPLFYAEYRLAGMRYDNHRAAKQSDVAVWSENDINEARTALGRVKAGE